MARSANSRSQSRRTPPSGAKAPSEGWLRYPGFLAMFAVVGAGVFGRYHAAKYANLPGVCLAALADCDPESRRAAANQFGLIPAADWRDLLGTVDMVSVCTPARTRSRAP